MCLQVASGFDEQLEKDDRTILVFAWRYKSHKLQLNLKPPQCWEGSKTVTLYWWLTYTIWMKAKASDRKKPKVTISNDKLSQKVLILIHVPCIFNYFLLYPTNAQIISYKYISQQSLCVDYTERLLWYILLLYRVWQKNLMIFKSK
jgi:hypothetical protein